MSTVFNIGSNNNFSNCQMGDDNEMHVSIHNHLSSNKWEELEYILKNEFVDKELSANESAILHNAKNLVTKKEERDFKNFVKQNKDSLIVNTLSNLVSDGLKFLFMNL